MGGFADDILFVGYEKEFSVDGNRHVAGKERRETTNETKAKHTKSTSLGCRVRQQSKMRRNTNESINKACRLRVR